MMIEHIKENKKISLSRPDSSYIEIDYNDGIITRFYEDYPVRGGGVRKQYVGQEVNEVINFLLACDWVIN